MSTKQTITTLPPSPDAERRTRMVKYSIAMTVRVACVVAMMFARDWWLLICAIGAIFLPYFAVVVANVQRPARRGEVLRPGGLVPVDAAGPEEAERTAGEGTEAGSIPGDDPFGDAR